MDKEFTRINALASNSFSLTPNEIAAHHQSSATQVRTASATVISKNIGTHHSRNVTKQRRQQTSSNSTPVPTTVNKSQKQRVIDLSTQDSDDSQEDRVSNTLENKNVVDKVAKKCVPYLQYGYHEQRLRDNRARKDATEELIKQANLDRAIKAVAGSKSLNGLQTKEQALVLRTEVNQTLAQMRAENPNLKINLTNNTSTTMNSNEVHVQKDKTFQDVYPKQQYSSNMRKQIQDKIIAIKKQQADEISKQQRTSMVTSSRRESPAKDFESSSNGDRTNDEMTLNDAIQVADGYTQNGIQANKARISQFDQNIQSNGGVSNALRASINATALRHENAMVQHVVCLQQIRRIPHLNIQPNQHIRHSADRMIGKPFRETRQVMELANEVVEGLFRSRGLSKQQVEIVQATLAARERKQQQQRQEEKETHRVIENRDNSVRSASRASSRSHHSHQRRNHRSERGSSRSRRPPQQGNRYDQQQGNEFPQLRVSTTDDRSNSSNHNNKDHVALGDRFDNGNQQTGFHGKRRRLLHSSSNQYQATTTVDRQGHNMRNEYDDDYQDDEDGYYGDNINQNARQSYQSRHDTRDYGNNNNTYGYGNNGNTRYDTNSNSNYNDDNNNNDNYDDISDGERQKMEMQEQQERKYQRNMKRKRQQHLKNARYVSYHEKGKQSRSAPMREYEGIPKSYTKLQKPCYSRYFHNKVVNVIEKKKQFATQPISRSINATTRATLGEDADEQCIIYENKKGKLSEMREMIKHASYETVVAQNGLKLEQFIDVPEITPEEVEHTQNELLDGSVFLADMLSKRPKPQVRTSKLPIIKVIRNNKDEQDVRARLDRISKQLGIEPLTPGELHDALYEEGTVIMDQRYLAKELLRTAKVKQAADNKFKQLITQVGRQYMMVGYIPIYTIYYILSTLIQIQTNKKQFIILLCVLSSNIDITFGISSIRRITNVSSICNATCINRNKNSIKIENGQTVRITCFDRNELLSKPSKFATMVANQSDKRKTTSVRKNGWNGFNTKNEKTQREKILFFITCIFFIFLFFLSIIAVLSDIPVFDCATRVVNKYLCGIMVYTMAVFSFVALKLKLTLLNYFTLTKMAEIVKQIKLSLEEIANNLILWINKQQDQVKTWILQVITNKSSKLADYCSNKLESNESAEESKLQTTDVRTKETQKETNQNKTSSANTKTQRVTNTSQLNTSTTTIYEHEEEPWAEFSPTTPDFERPPSGVTLNQTYEERVGYPQLELPNTKAGEKEVFFFTDEGLLPAERRVLGDLNINNGIITSNRTVPQELPQIKWNTKRSKSKRKKQKKKHKSKTADEYINESIAKGSHTFVTSAEGKDIRKTTDTYIRRYPNPAEHSPRQIQALTIMDTASNINLIDEKFAKKFYRNEIRDIYSMEVTVLGTRTVKVNQMVRIPIYINTEETEMENETCYITRDLPDKIQVLLSRDTLKKQGIQLTQNGKPLKDQTVKEMNNNTNKKGRKERRQSNFTESSNQQNQRMDNKSRDNTTFASKYFRNFPRMKSNSSTTQPTDCWRQQKSKSGIQNDSNKRMVNDKLNNNNMEYESKVDSFTTNEPIQGIQAILLSYHTQGCNKSITDLFEEAMDVNFKLNCSSGKLLYEVEFVEQDGIIFLIVSNSKREYWVLACEIDQLFGEKTPSPRVLSQVPKYATSSNRMNSRISSRVNDDSQGLQAMNGKQIANIFLPIVKPSALKGEKYTALKIILNPVAEQTLRDLQKTTLNSVERKHTNYDSRFNKSLMIISRAINVNCKASDQYYYNFNGDRLINQEGESAFRFLNQTELDQSSNKFQGKSKTPTSSTSWYNSGNKSYTNEWSSNTNLINSNSQFGKQRHCNIDNDNRNHRFSNPKQDKIQTKRKTKNKTNQRNKRQNGRILATKRITCDRLFPSRSRSRNIRRSRSRTRSISPRKTRRTRKNSRSKSRSDSITSTSTSTLFTNSKTSTNSSSITPKRTRKTHNKKFPIRRGRKFKHHKRHSPTPSTSSNSSNTSSSSSYRNRKRTSTRKNIKTNDYNRSRKSKYYNNKNKYNKPRNTLMNKRSNLKAGSKTTNTRNYRPNHKHKTLINHKQRQPTRSTSNSFDKVQVKLEQSNRYPRPDYRIMPRYPTKTTPIGPKDGYGQQENEKTEAPNTLMEIDRRMLQNKSNETQARQQQVGPQDTDTVKRINIYITKPCIREDNTIPPRYQGCTMQDVIEEVRKVPLKGCDKLRYIQRREMVINEIRRLYFLSRLETRTKFAQGYGYVPELFTGVYTGTGSNCKLSLALKTPITPFAIKVIAEMFTRYADDARYHTRMSTFVIPYDTRVLQEATNNSVVDKYNWILNHYAQATNKYDLYRSQLLVPRRQNQY